MSSELIQKLAAFVSPHFKGCTDLQDSSWIDMNHQRFTATTAKNRVEISVNFDGETKRIRVFGFWCPNDGSSVSGIDKIFGCPFFGNFFWNSLSMMVNDEWQSLQSSETAFHLSYIANTHPNEVMKMIGASGMEACRLKHDIKKLTTKDSSYGPPVNRMFCILRAKFCSDGKLADLLLATQDSFLIEFTKFDYFWGNGGGNDAMGLNVLGLLLMLIREIVRHERQMEPTMWSKLFDQAIFVQSQKSKDQFDPLSDQNLYGLTRCQFWMGLNSDATKNITKFSQTSSEFSIGNMSTHGKALEAHQKNITTFDKLFPKPLVKVVSKFVPKRDDFPSLGVPSTSLTLSSKSPYLDNPWKKSAWGNPKS